MGSNFLYFMYLQDILYTILQVYKFKNITHVVDIKIGAPPGNIGYCMITAGADTGFQKLGGPGNR